jgi:hypothetical protein
MTIQANFPAIKPSLLLDFANTKQLDSRITYTRASTASFYNGVTTAKAEENLMTYSQEIDNAAWVKVECTVTANTVAAPDGTTTAETLLETTANQYHAVYQLPALAVNQTYCISAYVKKNTRKYAAIGLGFNASNGLVIQVDLDAGTIAFSGSVGTGYSIVSSAISSVGSGWYRVSAVVTNGTNAGVFTLGSGGATLWTANTFQGNTFVGTTSDGIYVWGAQVEQRSAVTAYTATTTQAITNYIPALQSAASGVARFDNNPTTGESLGLLIEESRTNLLTYSEQFDNAIWSKVNSCTITANTIVAPDGTLTGDKLVRDSAAGSFRVQEATSVTSGTAYTFTCYAKASQLSWIAIGSQSSFPTNTYAFFNLSSGVLGTIGSGLTSASITSVGNGWYRCSITATANATAAGSFQIWLAQSDNNFSLSSGNTFDGVFLWGAQFEAGAFATSYIPTVASQVTRAADAASMTGTNFSTWYNQGQGTFYAEAFSTNNSTNSGDGVAKGVMSANDNTNDNVIWLAYQGNRYAVIRNTATIILSSQIGTFTANASFKTAAVYSSGVNFNQARDGTLGTAVTTGVAPTVSQLNIGRGLPSNGIFSGCIKKIAYYPLAVTNTNLQALTS